MDLKNRGQVSSVDFLAGLIIFILIFSSLRTVWIGDMSSGLIKLEELEQHTYSNNAFNVMLKTNGYPTNWNSSNVEIIGLAEKINVLSESKVNAFAAMDYENAKQKLALGEYDYSFDINSYNPSFNRHIGANVDGNKNIFSLKRSVQYRGGEASVTFKVFK